MIYGNKIKNLREENDMKSRDIDKILGLKADTFRKFEKEYTIIPIKHLNTICNYFKVSLDYIFDFTTTKSYKSSKEEIDINLMSTRLKEIRKENKVTQENLAEILNVVKGTIGNYESKRALIATPFLYTICKNYKVSADYLLGKIDTPKYLK